MRNVMFLGSFLVLSLSACAQSKVISGVSSEFKQNNMKQGLSQKCENARYQLDKTVEEGQLYDLRELKRNIELYCVWRNN